ncbi:MAG TPA: AAA family ATPase [Nitrolancea sp.]|nr:AAA family ATPase [Nitrolancea sp.]
MSGNVVGRMRVLLLEDDQGLVEHVRGLLRDEDMELNVTTGDIEQGLRQARNWSPDVILAAQERGHLPDIIEKLDASYSSTPIIALLTPEQAETAHEVLLAGARAYLPADTGRDELVDTIVSVLERERRRRTALARKLGVEINLGQVVAVHGAKGGVGATTVAANLAVAVQLASRARVALVDANLYSGDVAATLNLMSRGSLADLTPHLKELDQEFLERAAVRHASGLRAFLAPDDFVRAEVISGEQIQRILKVMRQHYDYIIVDTCSLPDQVTTAAMEEADRIVLVVTPELPALKNAARFLQLAGEFGYQGKVTLALNRANSRGALGLNDIQTHLRATVAVSIGSDGKAVMRAVNTGDPVIGQRRSRFNNGIWHLTALITGQQARKLKRLRRPPMPTPDAQPTTPGLDGHSPAPAANDARTRSGLLARLRPGQ